ncbi:MAG: permease [Desulfuromonadaceae bacterium]|nr:permease [Desulfuromonadaceae bacterium]
MIQCLSRSVRSFSRILPLLLAMFGLVALLQTLVTPHQLASFFSGNLFLDPLIGATAGSLAAGNPMISYILGGELLQSGISLTAVTAFILAWVNIGLLHLSVEMNLLGRRFTLRRNLLSFLFILLISMMTAITQELLK